MNSNGENKFRAAQFHAWVQSCYVFTLEDAVKQLRHAERRSNTTSSLMDIQGLDQRNRVGWLTQAYNIPRTNVAIDALAHARRRLDRWEVKILPGLRLNKWLAQLEMLPSWTPPKVRACLIRVAFNGWVTKGRMQQEGQCILGCRTAKDKIEHYAHCPIFHSLCRRFLGLPRPPADHCLEDFLGLRTFTDPSNIWEGRDKVHYTLLRAFGVYSLYKLHCAVKHGRALGACPSHSFRAYIRECASVNHQAAKLVACATKRLRVAD